MIGLLIVTAFVVYLAISCGVVWLVIRWARRTGRGVKRWAAAAILAMYLLVFWDHVPTLVLYKYYCATKAGFWVYKTPEQWKAENPGVAETLTWRERSPKSEAEGIQLNERFVWVYQESKHGIFPVGLTIETISDQKKNEMVVKRVSVWAGYVADRELYRFWAKMKPYIPKKMEFNEYWQAYKQLGREVK